MEIVPWGLTQLLFKHTHTYVRYTKVTRQRRWRPYDCCWGRVVAGWCVWGKRLIPICGWNGSVRWWRCRSSRRHRNRDNVRTRKLRENTTTGSWISTWTVAAFCTDRSLNVLVMNSIYREKCVRWLDNVSHRDLATSTMIFNKQTCGQKFRKATKTIK